MIDTLESAWEWYASARNIAKIANRLGKRHWTAMRDIDRFWRDDKLFILTTDGLLASSKSVIDELDDLCILLLFSVFESRVRDHVLGSVQATISQQVIEHPALKRALETLEDDVSHGSFYRVFNPYRPLDFNLADEVDQIRKFRNWVAHGRRGDQPSTVEPKTAFESLRDFLHLLTQPASTTGQPVVLANSPAAPAPVAPAMPLASNTADAAVLSPSVSLPADGGA